MRSARLATVETFVTFGSGAYETWEHDIPWRKFLQQFHSVKEIGLEGGVIPDIASAFQPNQGGSVLDFLPALENINLHTSEIRVRISRADSHMNWKPSSHLPLHVNKQVVP